MEAVAPDRSIRLRFESWLPLTVLLLAAFFVRTYDLARRPMHADEANQAVKTGELLETGHYAFDPLDHHGPTLYYAALPIARLRGETTLANLSERSVRLVPALAGVAGVWLLYLLAVPLGRWPALAAATFLAVSPPAVYYSRYFIQETLLATFTLGALLAAMRWWRSGAVGWALSVGIFAGLMQSTKASAPLFGGAAIMAWFAAGGVRPGSPHPWRHLAIAGVAALAVVILLYTSLGTHPTGLRDALLTYGQGLQRVSSSTSHEKPAWYYFQLFTWQRNGGLVWEQLGFCALALAGVGLALATPTKFLRWWAVYTAVVAGVLSITPYKTPWHAIHLVPGFAMLAAGALAKLPSRWLSVGAAVLVCGLLARQTELVAFTRASDARNPYAYVHSAPDVVKYRELAVTALARSPNGVVRVIGEEYWPLPWYLRGLPRVGYWSSVPAECDGVIVFASASFADEVRMQLHGPYRENYLGLRPGFTFVVFNPQTLAETK